MRIAVQTMLHENLAKGLEDGAEKQGCRGARVQVGAGVQGCRVQGCSAQACWVAVVRRCAEVRVPARAVTLLAGVRSRRPACPRRSRARPSARGVRGSASSRPKNCRPTLGGRLGGEIVRARPRSAPRDRTWRRAERGANVPACAGPATNSQNGSKSTPFARGRVVVMRRAVMDVGGDPHHVPDALRPSASSAAPASSSSRPSGDAGVARWRPPRGSPAGGRRRGRAACRRRRPSTSRSSAAARRPATASARAPMNAVSALAAGCTFGLFGAAIGAHVEREDLDERPEGNACDRCACRRQASRAIG